MQKTPILVGTRPKLLAVSAGPTRRVNQGVISPRTRPASQRVSPLVKPKGPVQISGANRNGLAKKAVLSASKRLDAPIQGQNGKLSVDQVLKQLGCGNERVLDDVVSSITRLNGVANNRRSPMPRSRSVPPRGADRKDMLLESFNSVAFRQQMQKSRQPSAARTGQLAPLKPKSRSPRYIHHNRVTAVGPCKCKSCLSKRTEPASPKDKPTRVSTSTKSTPTLSPSLAKSKTAPQLQTVSESTQAKVQSNPVPPPRKALEKSSAIQKSKMENQRVDQSSEIDTPSDPGTKKPFAFLQTLFKPNTESDGSQRTATATSKSQTAVGTDKMEAADNKAMADKVQTAGSRQKTATGIEKAPPEKTSAISTEKLQNPASADKKQAPKATVPDTLEKSQSAKTPATRGQLPGDPKPSSATYDRHLSTISEEKRDTLTMRRHSATENLSGSITMDDTESVVSCPFPRPRTGSTCCQSFQFMEVMTGFIHEDEEENGKDLEPFGMFDGVGGGNFINLKDDLSKNRKIIRSRLGIRMENKPDTVIQWKRGPILGRGAFGTVWCGLTMAGEMVAVKQAEISSIDLQKAQKEYEKVQQEVDLLKSLSHKNIVGYLGTSLEDKIVSIFMQFIPGGSLTSVLKKFGALAEPVVACYTKQILEGVEYLHSKNVVHRDIKGSNVMLMPNAIIKLIDFGCAKRAISLTKSNEEILKSMKGTPYWMAPEVMNETGHGKKSDIWSIGCTVFEMATSRPPWSNMNRYAALFSIANGSAPIQLIPEKFSVEAKRFVADCMIREPDKRPDATSLLTCPFILQYCHNGKRMLDSRGVPLNSTRRQ